MRTNERQRSLLNQLYEKTEKNPRGSVETMEVPDGLLQGVLYDLEFTSEQLRERVTALQSRNKDLEAYAHMIAHDLKDLLAVLVLSSDLITDIPDLSPQELDESLRQIKSTTYNMNRIIDNLLSFAEISTAEAHLEPVEMGWIVADVQDRLVHMIRETRAQIIFPEAWPEAIGYAPWIEEVWANYLSNALKHGGQPPHLELGASTRPDNKVCFWVRDQGPGIPTEVRARLFRPFSLSGPLHKLGHGLGLSIVLHIVEKMGGEVGVESELGKGSLFYFTLPTRQGCTGKQNLLPQPSDARAERSYIG
jgi:two-component system, sensor histidine kinase and response regulator